MPQNVLMVRDKQLMISLEERIPEEGPSEKDHKAIICAFQSKALDIVKPTPSGSKE